MKQTFCLTKPNYDICKMYAKNAMSLPFLIQCSLLVYTDLEYKHTKITVINNCYFYPGSEIL